MLFAMGGYARAQPDNEPGMAKPPANTPGVPGPPLTPEEKKAKTREIFSALLNPAKAVNCSTPESTIRSFLWAFFNLDFKSGGECVQNAAPYEKLKQFEEMMRKEMDDVELRVMMSDIHSYLDEDEATVTFHMLLSIEKTKERVQLIGSVERIKLQRVENRWQIISAPRPSQLPQPPIMGAWMLVEDWQTQIVQVFVAPEVVVDAGRTVSCQSNMKQLALAIVQHTEAHRGVFSLEGDLHAALKQYIGDAIITVCTEGDNKTYAFNKELNGKTLQNLPQPESLIMLYEGAEGKVKYLHQGQTATNIAFADGHVQTFRKDNLENALAKGTVRWK